MLFGMWTQVGPKNHVLNGGPHLPRNGVIMMDHVADTSLSEHSQSSRQLDVTGSAQQGAAMRPHADITLATYCA